MAPFIWEPFNRRFKMTQMEFAKKGKITPEMEYVAKSEGIDVKELMEHFKEWRSCYTC